MKKMFIISLFVVSFVSCKDGSGLIQERQSEVDIEGVWVLHNKQSKTDERLLSTSLANSDMIIITSDDDGLFYTIKAIRNIGDTPKIRSLGATLDLNGGNGCSLREGRGTANDLMFLSNASPTYFDLAVRKYTDNIDEYFTADDWVITGRYIRVPSISVNYNPSKHARELDDHWEVDVD